MYFYLCLSYARTNKSFEISWDKQKITKILMPHSNVSNDGGSRCYLPYNHNNTAYMKWFDILSGRLGLKLLIARQKRGPPWVTHNCWHQQRLLKHYFCTQLECPWCLLSKVPTCYRAYWQTGQSAAGYTGNWSHRPTQLICMMSCPLAWGNKHDL